MSENVPSEIYTTLKPAALSKKSVVRFALLERLSRFTPVLALVVLVLIWHFTILLFHLPPYVLPKPSGVFGRIFSEKQRLIENAWPTIQEILGGFTLSIFVGIPLAMTIVRSVWIDRMISPILVASQTIPKVAIAPILLIWFGLGMAPKILIAFLIAFFPIVISTTVGLRSVPRELIDLALSMGASRSQLFLRIRAPYALPTFFGGLKVAITLASIGAIVGEFVGASEGLGYLIMVANGRLDTELLFAVVIVLVVIGVILYWLVELLELVLVKRRQPQVGSEIPIVVL